jgi:hypothetical protein
MFVLVWGEHRSGARGYKPERAFGVEALRAALGAHTLLEGFGVDGAELAQVGCVVCHRVPELQL